MQPILEKNKVSDTWAKAASWQTYLIDPLLLIAVLLVRAIETVARVIANLHEWEASVVTEKQARLCYAIIVGDARRVGLEFAIFIAAVSAVLDAVTILLHWHARSVASTLEFVCEAQSAFSWAILFVLSCVLREIEIEIKVTSKGNGNSPLPQSAKPSQT